MNINIRNTVYDDYDSFIDYIGEYSGCEYHLSLEFYNNLRFFGDSIRWPNDYYKFVGMLDAMSDIDAYLDLTGNLDSIL